MTLPSLPPAEPEPPPTPPMRPTPPPAPKPVWWRRWRWEHLASLALLITLGVGLGRRPEALTEFTQAVRQTLAAAHAEYRSEQAVKASQRFGDTSLEAQRRHAQAALAWERVWRLSRDQRLRRAVGKQLIRHYRISDPARAVTVLQAIMPTSANDAGDADLVVLTAQALLQLGRVQDALTALENGLLRLPESDPGMFTVRRLLAATYDAMGRHDEAGALYLGLWQAYPDELIVRHDLALHQAELGDRLPQAEQLMREALVELERRDAVARLVSAEAMREHRELRMMLLDALGWVLFRQDRVNEARQVLGQARDLAGEHPDADLLAHLAWVHHSQGEDVVAAELLERALEADPQHAIARRLQRRMGGEQEPGTIS